MFCSIQQFFFILLRAAGWERQTNAIIRNETVWNSTGMLILTLGGEEVFHQHSQASLRQDWHTHLQRIRLVYKWPWLTVAQIQRSATWGQACLQCLTFIFSRLFNTHHDGWPSLGVWFMGQVTPHCVVYKAGYLYHCDPWSSSRRQAVPFDKVITETLVQGWPGKTGAKFRIRFCVVEKCYVGSSVYLFS
jgi:hypothetical protein